MNTVLMYVIMCLVCRFKALRGGLRNLKFDLHYNMYIYSQGSNFENLKFPTGLGFRQKVSERTVFVVSFGLILTHSSPRTDP